MTTKVILDKDKYDELIELKEKLQPLKDKEQKLASLTKEVKERKETLAELSHIRGQLNIDYIALKRKIEDENIGVVKLEYGRFGGMQTLSVSEEASWDNVFYQFRDNEQFQDCLKKLATQHLRENYSKKVLLVLSTLAFAAGALVL